MITYEQANEIFIYLPEEGKLKWRKAGLKRNPALNPGCSDKLGYRRVMINYKMYLYHRLIWLLHYKEWPKIHLDHIDRNPANNHISNLREVSHKLNMQNSNVKQTSKTGIRGLDYTKQGKVSLRLRGKYYGTFFTVEEAAKAREQILCCLNQLQNNKK